MADVSETITQETSEEVSTVAERPSGRRSSASPAAAKAGRAELGDSLDVTLSAAALREDEMVGVRRIAIVSIAMVAVSAALAPLLRTDPVGLWLLYGAAAIGACGSLWLLFVAQRSHRYTPRALAAAWELICISSLLGTIYFGVFSSASSVMLIGLYVLCQRASLRTSMLVYATFTLGHGVTGVAITAGWVDDPGLITVADGSPLVSMICLLLIHAIWLATFVLGRRSRSTMVEMMTELEHAARAIAKREALFEEARLDLDRAQDAGRKGRFSGETLGSFELGALLGRGGMGEVYEAWHRETGAPAAVKVLRAGMQGSPDHVRRFLREAQVASELEVPNVVGVLEVSDEESPLPYLAMERLSGDDLATILRRARQLPPAQVVELVRQVGAGISAAGAAGIVHRDLKPGNVFRDDSASLPVWKILDFGVAKLLRPEVTLTRGNVVGTPAYMAPEQAQAQEVDHRADLYSLAAIAYRALTGVPPFRNRELPVMLYQVVHDMPVRPTALADLPEEVDAVLGIGLAKRPEDRFASASDFADALTGALTGHLDEELRGHARALEVATPWTRGPGR